MEFALTPVAGTLAAIPLFSQAEPTDLEAVAARTRTVTVARGESVVEAGAPPTAFYCLVSGRVQLVVSAAPAGEKVLSLAGEGQTFGEALIFTGRPYPVTARALTDCELLAVPRGPVLELADRRPGFACRMAAGLAVRLHHLVLDIEQYALHSGTERVLALLRTLAEEQAAAAPARRVVLPAGKSVMASRLSLTPETFSRILRRLTDAGAIRVEGRAITLLDLEAAAATGVL